MLRLRDIMTTNVITLDPDMTIREAMDFLSSRRISGAPVVAGNDVIGVISASDLLQFAASLPAVQRDREAPPEWFPDVTDDGTEDTALGNADADDDPSALYFTELWDDAGGTVVDRIDTPNGADSNALEEHTVSEAMTPAPVHACTPDTLVTVAADYMRTHRIHRVLVMAGQTLIGLVSSSDITAAVADGKLTSRTFVFERKAHSGVREWWSRRR
jgi:CBS domain-containing protein